MRVAELQAFLRSLIGPLEAAEAKKSILDDLARACDGLDPFKDNTIGDFAGFLVRAEEYARTGLLPVVAKPASKPRTTKPKTPKITVEVATALVNDLYENAISDDLTHEMIAERIKTLSDLSAKDLETLAKNFGATAFKPKPKALEAIRDKISRRKSTHVRTMF